MSLFNYCLLSLVVECFLLGQTKAIKNSICCLTPLEHCNNQLKQRLVSLESESCVLVELTYLPAVCFLMN